MSACGWNSAECHGGFRLGLVSTGNSYSHGCEKVGILLPVHSWGFASAASQARLTWPGEDAVLKNFCHNCGKHLLKGLIETFVLNVFCNTVVLIFVKYGYCEMTEI